MPKTRNKNKLRRHKPQITKQAVYDEECSALQDLMNIGDVYRVRLYKNNNHDKAFIVQKIDKNYVRGTMQYIEQETLNWGKKHIITLHYSPILKTFAMGHLQFSIDIDYLKNADKSLNALEQMTNIELPIELKQHVFSFMQDSSHDNLPTKALFLCDYDTPLMSSRFIYDLSHKRIMTIFTHY